VDSRVNVVANMAALRLALTH